MRSQRHPGSVLTILALAIVHATHADEPKVVSRPVTITILHVFHEQPGGAAHLMATGDGVIYGTIPWGGQNAAGLVYRVSPDGTARILHTFSGPDGIYPVAPPFEGSDGMIYGAAQFGSTLSAQCGIYRIRDSGSFAVIYVLPNPIDYEKFVARIEGRSAGRLYTIEGGAPCDKYTAATHPPQKAVPAFSVVSEHVTLAGDSAAAFARSVALSEWIAAQQRLAEEIGRGVNGGCNPERPTPAATGQRFGAVTCQISGHTQCFIYQLDKSDAVSITYRFDVPLQYCRFPGPLVAGDDGNLYGAIHGYASLYFAVFRVEVAGRSGPSALRHH